MKKDRKRFKLKLPNEEVFEYQTKFKSRKTHFKKSKKEKYKNKYLDYREEGGVGEL